MLNLSRKSQWLMILSCPASEAVGLRSSSMAILEHDGLSFHYLDKGSGTPFFFQHGLGGDVNQTFGLFQPPPGIRLISYDCRAHGETRPLGDPEKF